MPLSSALPRATVEPPAEITLRALSSQADYSACVTLQRETWGAQFADYVPASLLKVSQMVGGLCVGAFSADGRMMGFVYGLMGVRDGRLIHWSHMLAVHPEYRDHGVGRRLKEYQRAVLRGQGIETIYWTFDPLVARNAHLNLNRLGTEVREYLPDMYQDTGSQLHAFGTDRLVVSWPVTGPAPAARPLVAGAAWLRAPLASAFGSEPLVRIEVPVDVSAIPVAQARAWRAATRPAFGRLPAEGYRVIGFFTEERTRSYYVLAKKESAS